MSGEKTAQHLCAIAQESASDFNYIDKIQDQTKLLINWMLLLSDTHTQKKNKETCLVEN